MSNITFWITMAGVLIVGFLAYRSAKKAQANTAAARNRSTPLTDQNARIPKPGNGKRFTE